MHEKIHKDITKLSHEYQTFHATMDIANSWPKNIESECVNPFVSNAPFLYSLKTSENLKVFWYFQGTEKECIEKKWVKLSLNI